MISQVRIHIHTPLRLPMGQDIPFQRVFLKLLKILGIVRQGKLPDRRPVVVVPIG
jgi:hypothetical protein